jgi:hypothetical protein
LEYRGATVQSAEEAVFEDGTVELRWLLDVGLGQERVLLVERFSPQGTRRYSSFHSADRLSVYVPASNLPQVEAGLIQCGFEVRRNRYGATVLSVKLPSSLPDYFATRFLLDQVVQDRGEIFLTTSTGYVGENP